MPNESGLDLNDLEAMERILQLRLDTARREAVRTQLQRHLTSAQTVRDAGILTGVPPASIFSPLTPDAPVPPAGPATGAGSLVGETTPVTRLEDVPSATLRQLAVSFREGHLTSLSVTEYLLAHIAKHDGSLQAIVTPLTKRALSAARRADEAFAEGVDLGPLQGIPYLAKDLLAVPEAPTTWGISRHEHRVLDGTAAVVERLDQAGAVLLAKVSMGELAMGDVWFGGTTKNPWDLSEGSSGSSAGSAAGLAAGYAPLAIGSETMGSILSPSARCGVVGLRPTFGRVSRFGAMPLSWSLDKIGPMTRSAADAALAFSVLAAKDPRDPVSREAPFPWPPQGSVRDAALKLRVGVPRNLLENPPESLHAFLNAFRTLGGDAKAIDDLPSVSLESMMTLLMVEASSQFDDMVRDGSLDGLVSQDENAWPTHLRAAQYVSGVDYLQAQRMQRHIRDALTTLFGSVDVLVTPSTDGSAMLAGNGAGFPALSLPVGRGPEGRPLGSVALLGRADFEHEPLLLGVAIEELEGPLVLPPAFRDSAS